LGTYSLLRMEKKTDHKKKEERVKTVANPEEERKTSNGSWNAWTTEGRGVSVKKKRHVTSSQTEEGTRREEGTGT